jgi:hypothetical protein
MIAFVERSFFFPRKGDGTTNHILESCGASPFIVGYILDLTSDVLENPVE